MKFPAEADKCGDCDGIFVGLSGSTKWCPYCGAGHEGETVPMPERVPVLTVLLPDPLDEREGVNFSMKDIVALGKMNLPAGTVLYVDKTK